MVGRIDNNVGRINTRVETGSIERLQRTETTTRPELRDNFARIEDRDRPKDQATPAGGRMLDGSLTSQPFAAGSNVSWNNAPTQPRGVLEGFDAGKLANESHNSAKYICARIFQKYPNTPEGLRQALPEIQKHFPDAKIIGSKGDKIDFGNSPCPRTGEKLGVVDVIRAAGEGGKAWQWGPDGPSQGQATQNFAARDGMLYSNLRIADLDPSAARDDQWALIAQWLQQMLAGAKMPAPRA